ncbi:Golgin sub A member 2 [Gonapodya sp. JEL0774]|nr:Golgin sub A member 2 [Gonapodya sp. JEL0774]
MGLDSEDEDSDVRLSPNHLVAQDSPKPPDTRNPQATDEDSKGKAIMKSDTEERSSDGKVFGMSQELLARERELLRINKEFERKTKETLKAAESAVKGTRETLERPAPGTNEIDEITETPEAVRQAKLTAQSEGGGEWKTKQRRLAESTAKSTCDSVRSRGKPSTSEIPSRQTNLKQSDNVINNLSIDNTDFTADANLGSDATIRFLKAKVQVLQKELEKIVSENHLKSKAISAMEESAKILVEDRANLGGQVQGLQTQLEKQKAATEELKRRCDAAEAEARSVRKDLDLAKKSQKQSHGEGAAKDARLSRALEEVEKYKAIATRATADAKVAVALLAHEKLEISRRSTEKLLGDVKRLEKQRGEVLQAFRKQAQLVDVLKKQKVHLEAAKLLEFTEEEFVKALETGRA